MFSPKIRITERGPGRTSLDDRSPGDPFAIHGEGNPNLIDGGWDFPDDLGMSRADVYPSKHEHAWYTRLAERWVI